jgi:hypothetical protein
MVALYVDLMIRFLEVVAPLLPSLHNGQELPMVRGVVLFGTWAFSSIDVDRSVRALTTVFGLICIGVVIIRMRLQTWMRMIVGVDVYVRLSLEI